MVQCQQITKAIRMILDEARRAQQKMSADALRQVSTDSSRWRIMQMPDQVTGIRFRSVAKQRGRGARNIALFKLTTVIVTRSSAIRRESAHLTWLYCTVQKAFQNETRVDHECDSTAAPSVESIWNDKLETWKTEALSTAYDLSLTHSFRVNP